MINLSESGHPVFRGSSAFERGSLRSKEGGKLSKHSCGDTDTVEVALRTIISVSRPSVYGAVAEMCDELASRICHCSESTGRQIRDHGSTNRLGDNDQTISDHRTVQGDLLREYERKFANLQDDI